MENTPGAGTGARKYSRDDRDAEKVAGIMVIALVIGGGLAALGLPNMAEVWAGLLWAAAWSAVGWFLGFLFGIPRSLSTDTARTSTYLEPSAENNTLKAAFDKASTAYVTAKKSSDDAEAVSGTRKTDLQTAIDDEAKASDAAAANPGDQNLLDRAATAKTTRAGVQTASERAGVDAINAAQLAKHRSDELVAAEAAMKSERRKFFA